MEIKNFNLEKYYQRIIYIREVIDILHPLKKIELERIVIISWNLQQREILNGNKLKTKWQKYFEGKLKSVKMEFEELEKIVDRYDFDKNIPLVESVTGKKYTLKKEGKFIDYFLPSIQEIKEIEYFRKNSLEYEIKRFENDFELSVKPKELFVNEVLNGLNFQYSVFYENDEPIQMGVLDERRDFVLMNFANDLGIYDFIQYLTNELAGKSDIVDTNKWHLPKRIQLLSKIGFFDLDYVKKLSSDRKRGLLVNQILGISDDNTRDYISDLVKGSKSIEKNKDDIEYFIKNLMNK